ncbi:MAG: glucose-6-phosphate isomerase, partial [Ruminococcaceae bacterium]|nr:glucose-6-phosphate isomerase [Oscillospiraceae bacterium]
MLKFDTKYLNGFVSEKDLESIRPEIEAAFNTTMARNGAGSDFLGWLDLPENYDKEEYDRIKKAAEKIRSSCDILIVIGIGGSYLGARAAIEFIHSSFYNSKDSASPKIYFAGNNMDPTYLTELLDICKGKDICVNVISKSGTTTEPSVAFRIFRKLLEEKYGLDGARERIFATTDKARGKLKELADRMGYETFVVPDDVGGRYSVLTAVGLLPIAVSGADIDAMMKGAKDAKTAVSICDINTNAAMKYAAYRNILYRRGLSTEIFVTYDSSVQMLAEWWKQLYGESEGKDGKGIYPSSVTFSTDLHSLGQYIQDGERKLFETVLIARNTKSDITIEPDSDNADGLNFLDGMKLGDLNLTAYVATALAHADGGVPNIVLEYEK